MAQQDIPPGTVDEMNLRAAIPVYVNSFEQLTYVRASVDWFHAHGFRNVTVLEQGSVYAPLLDYFGSDDFTAKARLLPLGKNIGPRRAVRKSAVFCGKGKAFIFTDPDLELPDPIAVNFLTRMFALGAHYRVPKVGLALDISDSEKISLQTRISSKHTVYSYFKRFYRNKLERNVWGNGVDTTFFLHVPQPHMAEFGIMTSQPRIPAVRVGGLGFLAGHRPWYFDNGMSPEEEDHYRSRTSIASTFFGRAA